MATTIKLNSTNAYYGYSSYSNSASIHMYVGAENNSTKYDYRSRVTFPALSSLAEIGDNRINIRSMTLYLRRNDGGPTQITIGCSSSGTWGAPVDKSVQASIPASTGVYAVDVTDLADAVEGYNTNWYIHFSDGTPRLRLDGTGKSTKPYLEITWEYAAATITGNVDSVTLGNRVTYTITPEVSGETHTLEYSLGDSSGVIAARAGNSIQWTPPRALAAEIPDDDTATVEIRMTAYDSGGSVQRTEVYYQTVRVPDDMLPVFRSAGMSLLGGLNGYGLTGRSSLNITPVIDMNGAYGATVEEIIATIIDGISTQTLQWTALTETDAGVFTGAAAQSGVLTAAGQARVELAVTDSRGRTVTAQQNFTVCEYAPPVIAGFSVERYEPVYDENEAIIGYQPSDLGGYVWVNIQASVSSIAPAGAQLNLLSWTIHSQNTGTGETLSSDGSGAQSVSIVQDREIIPGITGEGETWLHTLTVTDTAGSSAVQYSTVSPARVALSIAPDKRGVGVGMVATGNEFAPKFEVAEEYTSHFYGSAFDKHGVEIIGSKLLQHVHHTTPISVPTSTDMDFDIFTADESGLYAVSFTGSWVSNASGIRAVILRDPAGNNIALSRFNAGGTGAIQQNVSGFIPLASGQSIGVRIWQNSGGNLDMGYFIAQIVKIGAIEDAVAGRLYDANGNVIEDSAGNEIALESDYMSRYAGQRINAFISEVN